MNNSCKPFNWKIPKRKKCEQCLKEAVIELAYGPQYYCKEHFEFLIEKRVKRTVRKYALLKKGEKLLVAMSGGKDSTVAAYLMQKIFGKTNELQALLIDEGITGYRDKALAFAEKSCREWKIPFTRVAFKEEFGITMQEIQKALKKEPALGTTCSFCGVLRRQVMNKYAKKLKADKLVTGHNLDDETQSILMNVCDNKMELFVRQGAISGGKNSEKFPIQDLRFNKFFHKKFIPRIKPLYEIPEIETLAFARFKELDFYAGECCPMKWQAKRNEYRRILNELEEKYPGTKHSAMQFYNSIKEKINLARLKDFELHSCKLCGEPSSREICKVCEKIEEIGKFKKENEWKEKKQSFLKTLIKKIS